MNKLEKEYSWDLNTIFGDSEGYKEIGLNSQDNKDLFDFVDYLGNAVKSLDKVLDNE